MKTKTDPHRGFKLPKKMLSKSHYLLPMIFCSALITACGGSGSPILGGPVVGPVVPPVVADIINPTITSTAPTANATGVALNAKVAVLFSESMAAATINSTNVTLSAAGVSVPGSVTYASNSATFTPTVALLPNTVYTGLVTTGVTDVAGNKLAANYTWTFTTGATPDVTAPMVSSTIPVNLSTNVATNSQISAVFNEDIDPTTINAGTFTLTGTAPINGTVSYSAPSKTVIFTPSNPSVLPANTSLTGTITTGVKDLAGNPLASNYVWKFTTGAAADVIPPTVTLTNPLNAALVCSNKTLNATFSEAIDPTTLNASTFTLQPSGPPLGANVSGTISYDPVNLVASFVPSALANNTAYTATITTGVKDLAGNALAANKVVTFTTQAQACPTAPALGAASTFGSFGGNATITNDGLNTIINGDIGVNAASTTVTGFTDNGGNVYTVTPNNNGKVNGLVYTLTAPPGSVAGAAVTQAKIDAKKAYDSISPAVLPNGIDVSSLAQCPSCGGAGGGADELAGRTLPPGVYLSSTGTYDIGGAGRTTADLVLDAQGDANAVWIFQTAAGTGTLNVGVTGPATPATPIKVRVINGGQAKNVFWYVPAGAVLNTGSTVTGTLLADAAITMSTTGGSPPTAVLTTLNGRAISLTAGVTMTNTVVNVPAP